MTITNPEFLFEFVSEQTNDELYIVLPNTSLSTDRYDEFTIEGGTDIVFPIDGYYTYNIYEQEVSGNLDPTGLNKVETGRVYVYDTNPTGDYYTNDTLTTEVYEPES